MSGIPGGFSGVGAALTVAVNNIVAAIGALFPSRVQDAGNSSVAALGALGVFTGVWARTDSPTYKRLDVELTVAGTATLAVQHSDDGVNPIAALTETWVVSAAVHPMFPTVTPRRWVRVVLTDTSGVPNAVTLTAWLDPRDTSDSVPLVTTNVSQGGAGNIVTTRPLGARVIEVRGAYVATAPLLNNVFVDQLNAAAAVIENNYYIYCVSRLKLMTACASVRVTTNGAITAELFWYS